MPCLSGTVCSRCMTGAQTPGAQSLFPLESFFRQGRLYLRLTWSFNFCFCYLRSLVLTLEACVTSSSASIYPLSKHCQLSSVLFQDGIL